MIQSRDLLTNFMKNMLSRIEIRLISILLITFLALGDVFAEDDVNTVISQGIKYAEQGHFDQAILEFNLFG